MFSDMVTILFILNHYNRHIITLDQYLSEDYYYGDYTKMSSWLYKQYHLPEELYVNRCPDIEETDFSRTRGILKVIKDYRKVSVESAQPLKGFDRKN